MLKKFRLKYIVLALVLLGFVFSIFFFMGSIIHKVLIVSGQSIVKAKVEIQDVDVSYFPFRVEITGIDVANPKKPMENIFSLDRVVASVHFSALMKKKLLIDELSLNRFSFGTKRQVSGQLEKYTPENQRVSADTNLEMETETNEVFKSDSQSQNKVLTTKKKPSAVKQQLKKVKQETASLMDGFGSQLDLPTADQLKFPKVKDAINDSRRSITDFESKWEEKSKTTDYSKDFEKIKLQFQSLKDANINASSDVKRINQWLSDFNQLQADINTLQGQLNSDYRDLQTDSNLVIGQINRIQKIGSEEISMMMSQVRLDKVKQIGLSDLIMGTKLKTKWEEIQPIIKQVLVYKSRFKGPQPPKKRGRLVGQDIVFSQKGALPKVWIKKINISGKGKKGDYLSGYIDHLTTDQSLIGRPMIGELKGLLADKTEFEIDLKQDSRIENVVTKVNTTFNHYPLKAMEIYQQSNQKIILKNGILRGSSNVTLYGINQIDLQSVLTGYQLNFQAKEPVSKKMELDSIISRIILGTDQTSMDIKIKGRLSQPHVVISSDLDKQVSKQLNRLLQMQVDEWRSNVQKKMESEVSRSQEDLKQSLQQYQNTFSKKQREIKDKLGEMEATIQSEKNKAEQKLKAIENEAKNNIEKAAKDQLKNLKQQFSF